MLVGPVALCKVQQLEKAPPVARALNSLAPMCNGDFCWGQCVKAEKAEQLKGTQALLLLHSAFAEVGFCGHVRHSPPSSQLELS